MNRNISVIAWFLALTAKVSRNMYFKINNIMIWTRYYVIKTRPTETAELTWQRGWRWQLLAVTNNYFQYW